MGQVELSVTHTPPTNHLQKRYRQQILTPMCDDIPQYMKDADAIGFTKYFFNKPREKTLKMLVAEREHRVQKAFHAACFELAEVFRIFARDNTYFCQECLTPFQMVRNDQLYCSGKCKQAAYRLRLKIKGYVW